MAKLCVVPPKVFEVQERARGPLSPCQVRWGSDFSCLRKRWIFVCQVVCHSVELCQCQAAQLLCFSERSLYAIAHPSVLLSSVMLVRPTQPVEIFCNISTGIWYLGYPLTCIGDRLRGTPLSGELNPRGVAKHSDFEPIEGYISETLQDRR